MLDLAAPTDQIEQEQPDTELAYTDAQFYSDLVVKGIEHMRPVAQFGRAALEEIGGEALRDTLIGRVFPLRSTHSEATDIGQPVSIFQRVMDTYLPAIAPRELDSFVKPKRQEAVFDANLQEIRGQMLMEETQFSSVDRDCVVQALCTGYGVRVTLPATGIMTLIANEDIDEGAPATWNVYVMDEDYACDPAARNTREERFRAVRLRLSSRLALTNGYMTQEQIDKCEKVEQGDCEDLIYLWLVCVYERTRIRWGFLCKPGMKEWLVELTDWDGHPNGPISVLKLKPHRVKNREFSPLHQLADLHKAMGRLMQEVVRRGIVEKNIITGQDLPEDFQKKTASAQHNAFISTSTPLSQITLGGLTPSQVALLPILQDANNNSTANLQQSSGSKGVSDTAREAMILQSNADRILNDLKRECSAARNNVFSQLMYYDYYGQQAENGLSLSLPVTTVQGTELMSMQIAPQDREADYFDMTFETCTSDARDMDPAVRLQLTIQLGKELAGMVMAIAQLGGNPDPLIRDLVEYSGMESLAEIFPTPSGQIIMQARQMAAMQEQQEEVKEGESGAPPGGGGGKGPQPGNELGAMGVMTPIGPTPPSGQPAPAFGGVA